MVIGNGFIAKTTEEAIERIKKEHNDTVVRIPLPYVCDTMSYYISKTGKIFGFQKYKNFFLVKEKRVEKKYSAGPSFRVSLGAHKEKQIYVAYALYYTFIMNSYREDLKLSFRDGDSYNINLDNIYIGTNKKESITESNMKKYAAEYSKNFTDLVWYAKKIGFPSVDWQDAEDVVSDSFCEVCRKEGLNESILGLWIQTLKYRVVDLHRERQFVGEFYTDSGEEKYGKKDKEYEVDLLRTIRGKKRRMYIQLWMDGYSATEIAEITNSSRSTVASSNTRTIQSLRCLYLND